MDISKVVKKVRQQDKERHDKITEERKHLKRIKQELLSDAKKIEINTDKIDNYLNPLIQDNIKRNVYALSLTSDELKDLFIVFNIQDQLGNHLDEYIKLGGSQYGLYSKINKIVLKKVVKYINSNDYYHATIMQTAPNDYELNVYINF